MELLMVGWGRSIESKPHLVKVGYCMFKKQKEVLKFDTCILLIRPFFASGIGAFPLKGCLLERFGRL